MRRSSAFKAAPWASLLLIISTLFTSGVSAASNSQYIISNSLRPCMDNSAFTANHFDISLHPNTSRLYFDIDGYSTVQGNVKMYLTVFAYGFKATKMSFDPCTNGWTQLCPMNPGKIELNSNEVVGDDMIAKIPKIAYQVPDIDGTVRIEVVSASNTSNKLACMDAKISNGRTVEQSSVSWATAIITGVFLLAAITAISMSSPHTPDYRPAIAKFAIYSFALFVFFQMQALFGMTSVPMPPIVAAWVQNFMWTVGIVQTSGLQKFLHWYIQSTGGQITRLLSQTQTTVLVIKRNAIPAYEPPLGERDFSSGLWKRAATEIQKRAEDFSSYQQITVKGIERVAYKVGIERTNVFITAYGLLIIVILSVLTLFMLFKLAVYLMVKKQIAGMQNKLLNFRSRWREILKTIVLSILVMAYPGITALCLWEFTMKDSPGAVALAAIMLAASTGLMGYFIYKVIIILKENSIAPFGHRGLLRTVGKEDKEKRGVVDATAELRILSAKKELKQFGLLTLLYRIGCMFWVVPMFVSTFTIAALIGLAQQHYYQPAGSDISTYGAGKGAAQAIGILVIELFIFICFCWARPWYDRRTNVVGIMVGLVAVLDSIFLLIFSGIFPGQPATLSSVLGVVYFAINALTSLVLLILVIVAAIYAIVDWHKGDHEVLSGSPTDSAGSDSNPSTYRPSNVGTPDPFVPPAHINYSAPSSSMTAVDSRTDTGLVIPKGLSDEELANRHASVTESLDSTAQIHDLKPTEPNMSTGDLGRVLLFPHAPVSQNKEYGQANSQAYQMQPLTQVHSHNSNIVAGSGVVGIAARPGSSSAYAESQRSGRSGHGQPYYNQQQQYAQQYPPNPHYPPQFQRQESHVSLRSVRSSQSQRSNFPRPGAPNSAGGGFVYGAVGGQDVAPPRHSISTRSTTSRDYFREPRGNNTFAPTQEYEQSSRQEAELVRGQAL